MAGSGFPHLEGGPEPCPVCGDACTHPKPGDGYVLGGPPAAHPDHPQHEAWKERQMPKKRPHGKRRPAEDRARRLRDDR